MQIPVEKYRRMEAALRNILDISKDEFCRSQARYGLGIKTIEDIEEQEWIRVNSGDFNLD